MVSSRVLCIMTLGRVHPHQKWQGYSYFLEFGSGKDTPIFSVIKPVTIPNKRSAPKRSLMVIIYGFIGFIVSCGFFLIKEPVLNVLKEINA